MNIFRIAADSTHVLALLVLLYKLLKTKSAAGVSGNTQILYGVVFCTRYNDLFINFISIYNTSMKILLISVAFFFVYLIFFRYKKTYERKLDTCRLGYLEIPCIFLAFLYNEGFTFAEISWAFSIYLEAVAIVPQMVLIYNAGKTEKYIMPYLLLLGTYRALYIFNWMFRYVMEDYYDVISYRSGFVQILIYLGFLTYYGLFIKDKTENKSNYSANLSQHISNEKLLGEKPSSADIPSVFIIGSKQSYGYSKELNQAAA